MLETHWIDAAQEADLPEGDVMGLQLGSRDIALYKVEGSIFATDNTCSHGSARLCDGYLEGFEIECPYHQGRFDVRNGRGVCAPVTQDIRSYPVRIEGGRVWVQLGD
jgi:naphthalene 1,2-dioxygenase ferredoxin component